MATRALIGYLDTDGGVLTTTYNHYDGYPSNLGKALKNFFNSDSLAKDLANYGYVSYIDPQYGEIEANHTQSPGVAPLSDNFEDAMDEIAYEIDAIGGDYGYIWDNSKGEWITIENEGIGEMSQELEMELAHLKDKFGSKEMDGAESHYVDNDEADEDARLSRMNENFQTKWKKFLNEDNFDMPGFEGTKDQLNNLSLYQKKPSLDSVISQAFFQLQDEPNMLLNQYKKSLANDIRLNGPGQYEDFTVEDFIEDYQNYTQDKMSS